MSVALDPWVLNALRQAPVICNSLAMPNGYVSRLHRHVGLEVVYCLSGDGAIHIGRQTIPYGEGTLVYFDSQLPHQCIMRGEYRRWNLCFWPESIGELASDPDVAKVVREVRPGPGQVHLFSVSPRIARSCERLFASLLDELESRQPGFELVVRLRLVELHVLLSRLRSKQRTLAADPQRRAQGSAAVEILNFIEARLADDISTSAIAKAFHYSRSQVNRIIRQATAKTAIEYIRERRLARARFLLETTDLSIKQVAERVGYSNVPYFCRLFREATGCTPGEYRGLAPLPAPHPGPTPF